MNVNSESATSRPSRRRLVVFLTVMVVALSGIGFAVYKNQRPPINPETEIASFLSDLGIHNHRAAERLSRLEKQTPELADVTVARWVFDCQNGKPSFDPAHTNGLNWSDCNESLLLKLAQQVHKSQPESAAIIAREVADRHGAAELDALKLLFTLSVEARANDQESLLRRLLEFQPSNAVLWGRLVQKLNQAGDQEATLQVLMDALKAPLPPADLMQFRADGVGLLLLRGDADEARKWLEPLLRTRNRPVAIQLLEVKLLRLEGSIQEGLDQLAACFDRLQGSQRSEALALKSSLLIDAGDYQSAAMSLEELIEQDPFDHFVHLQLADAYRGLGNSTRAEEEHARGIRLRTIRHRIHELTTERHPSELSSQECQELAGHYRELNDSPNAVRWEREADRR